MAVVITIHEPIHPRWAVEDPPWPALWPVIVAAARGPIRRHLRANHLDDSLEDDLLQDLYLHLGAAHARCLRAFRGGDERRYRHFLRTVAGHFAANWVRHWRRVQARESAAWRAAARPERAGPSEPEVVLAYAELEEVLPGRFRGQLRAIVQPPGPIPARTGRRWTADLRRVVDRHLE